MSRAVKNQHKLTIKQIMIQSVQSRIDDIKFESVDVETMYRQFEYNGNKAQADILRLLLESIDSLQGDFNDLLLEIE